MTEKTVVLNENKMEHVVQELVKKHFKVSKVPYSAVMESNEDYLRVSIQFYRDNHFRKSSFKNMTKNLDGLAVLDTFHSYYFTETGENKFELRLLFRNTVSHIENVFELLNIENNNIYVCGENERLNTLVSKKVLSHKRISDNSTYGLRNSDFRDSFKDVRILMLQDKVVDKSKEQILYLDTLLTEHENEFYGFIGYLNDFKNIYSNLHIIFTKQSTSDLPVSIDFTKVEIEPVGDIFSISVNGEVIHCDIKTFEEEVLTYEKFIHTFNQKFMGSPVENISEDELVFHKEQVKALEKEISNLKRVISEMEKDNEECGRHI